MEGLGAGRFAAALTMYLLTYPFRGYIGII